MQRLSKLKSSHTWGKQHLKNLLKCIEYFCIGFIHFMLKDKGMLDYTDFFSPNDYEKNDKIIKTILFVNRFLES